MRALILFSYLLLIGTVLNGQLLNPVTAAAIVQHDADIYEWDRTGVMPPTIAPQVLASTTVNNPNGQQAEFTGSEAQLLQYVQSSFLPLFDITAAGYNRVIFSASLDRIQHTETITWLEFVFEDVIATCENNPTNTTYNLSQLYEMQGLINKRMQQIMDEEITMYRFTETSNKWCKFIYVDHSNDFMSFYNDDRDMTGGFRMEVGTDKLKMRLLGGYSNSIWNLNSRQYYSYQSVFLGGEGYTPYLRDSTIFNTDTAYDVGDRPYASFRYFGRAKYRVTRRGRFRMFNQVKFGTIGSATPDKIQSTIHRDVIIGSLRPQGWGAQIASGGRIGFSMEYYPEWMIYGSVKDHADRWINISGLLEGKLGTDMTSVGFGFGLCNKGFLKTGGINVIFMDRSINSLSDFFTHNIVLDYRCLFRYVIHNSMLEGYGVFDHALDEDKGSPRDKYFLSGDQIERTTQVHQFTISMRFKYCAIVFKQTFISPEYDLPVNTVSYAYADESDRGFRANHNTHVWNHYGTIGIVFKVAK